MKSWLAARTRSRYEKFVASQLTAREVEHYLPLYKEKRRDGLVELVLIPGYCFVQTETPKSVLSIVGVCGFVTFQSRPAEIPESEIEMLRAATRKEFKAREHSGFSLRQAVRITGTPFDGFVGTIDSVSGCRVRVIIPTPSIEKCFSVELLMENVEPLPSHGVLPPLMTEIPQGVH